MEEHKDYLDQDLKLGDYIVALCGTWFTHGIVVRMTEQQVMYIKTKGSGATAHTVGAEVKELLQSKKRRTESAYKSVCVKVTDLNSNKFPAFTPEQKKELEGVLEQYNSTFAKKGGKSKKSNLSI